MKPRRWIGLPCLSKGGVYAPVVDSWWLMRHEIEFRGATGASTRFMTIVWYCS